jgi:hypothetical protein
MGLSELNLIEETTMAKENDGSMVMALFWMFLISLLLFWLPFIGPLIAGIVGGKAAGGVGAALMAVLVPCIVFGALLFFIASSLTGVPVIGMVAGVGGLALALAHVGPLLLGAIIGGVMA